MTFSVFSSTAISGAAQAAATQAQKDGENTVKAASALGASIKRAIVAAAAGADAAAVDQGFKSSSDKKAQAKLPATAAQSKQLEFRRLDPADYPDQASASAKLYSLTQIDNTISADIQAGEVVHNLTNRVTYKGMYAPTGIFNMDGQGYRDEQRLLSKQVEAVQVEGVSISTTIEPSATPPTDPGVATSSIKQRVSESITEKAALDSKKQVGPIRPLTAATNFNIPKEVFDYDNPTSK